MRKDLKKKVNNLEKSKEFIKNSNAKHYRLPAEMLESPYNLMIMTEHDEIANHMINERIGKDLMNICGTTGTIQEIHITDKKTYNNIPLYMRAVLSLQGAENDKMVYERVADCIKTCLQLVD